MPRTVPTPNAKGRYARSAKGSRAKPTSMKKEKATLKRKEDAEDKKVKKTKVTEVNRYALTDDLVIQGIETMRGNITKIAEALGQSRPYVSAYIREQDADGNYKRPQLVAMLEEYQVDVQADLAEWELQEAVSRGEPWAVALTVKSLRKQRYGDKPELEQQDTRPKIVEVVVVHHKADSSPLRVAVSGDAPNADQERVATEPASGAAESLGIEG